MWFPEYLRSHIRHDWDANSIENRAMHSKRDQSFFQLKAPECFDCKTTFHWNLQQDSIIGRSWRYSTTIRRRWIREQTNWWGTERSTNACHATDATCISTCINCSRCIRSELLYVFLQEERLARETLRIITEQRGKNIKTWIIQGAKLLASSRI